MNEEIIAELRAIRAAIEQLPAAICASVLTDLIEQDPAPAAAPPQGCQHPVDKRIDLGDGEWECGVRECRHQHLNTPAVPV